MVVSHEIIRWSLDHSHSMKVTLIAMEQAIIQLVSVDVYLWASIHLQFTFFKPQHLAALAGQFHGMGYDDQG